MQYVGPRPSRVFSRGAAPIPGPGVAAGRTKEDNVQVARQGRRMRLEESSLNVASPMSPPTPARPATTPRGARRWGLLYLLLWLVLAVPILIVGTALFGYVEGIEFSPNDFSRRTFSFYEIPLLGIQATPIKRVSQTGPLEQFLVAQKWITVSQASTWDVVRARRGQHVIDPGTASILCHYLDAADPKGNHAWLVWSQAHGPQAAKLWPLVADLARNDLYAVIPDVMRAALEHVDLSPEPFAAALQRLSADRCVTLGSWYAAQGDTPRARQCFQLALGHQPQHPVAAGRLAELDEQP
jgi:hypothetical protein